MRLDGASHAGIAKRQRHRRYKPTCGGSSPSARTADAFILLMRERNRTWETKTTASDTITMAPGHRGVPTAVSDRRLHAMLTRRDSSKMLASRSLISIASVASLAADRFFLGSWRSLAVLACLSRRRFRGFESRRPRIRRRVNQRSLPCPRSRRRPGKASRYRGTRTSTSAR
jgi:hypothetical protein